MDQTTMSTKGMILLLLSVLEFKLGVYTVSTLSREMDQCGWDVKQMGYCPPLPSNNVSWTCLANLKACDGGLKYHCARGYGKEEDKFVEACRKSKICIMGREPRISFEPNNNIEIFCELCFDVDHYNSVPTKSSTEFSECPYKKIICSEDQIECKKTNNPEASSRFCRCDARNGYIEEGFSPPETGTYDPCRNKQFRCVKATPCNAVNEIPQERMLNYTCKPECQDGYGRNETSDECRRLASPTKPNSTVTTKNITNSTTPKYNTTTQGVKTTNITTAKPDDPKPQVSIGAIFGIVAGVLFFLAIVICIIKARNTIRRCWKSSVQNVAIVSGHDGRRHSVIYRQVSVNEPDLPQNGSGQEVHQLKLTTVQEVEVVDGGGNHPSNNDEVEKSTDEDNKSTVRKEKKETDNSGSTIIKITYNIGGDLYDAKNILQGKGQILDNTGGGDSNSDMDNGVNEIKTLLETIDKPIQAMNTLTSTVTASSENKDGSEVSKNNSDIMYEGDDNPESDGLKTVGNLGDNNSDGKRDKNIANLNDRRDRASSVSGQPSARYHRQRKMSKSLGSVRVDDLEVEIKDLTRLKMTDDQSEGFGKRVLNKCYTCLIENLDIESTLDQCQEKGLLTAVQIKDIKSVKPSDRVRDTLDHISKGGIRKYEEFKKCLCVTKQNNLLKHLQDMEESQNKEDLATLCQSEPDGDNENGSGDNNGGSGGSNGYGDMGGDNDGSGGSNGYGDIGSDNDGSGGSNGYGDMGGDNGGSGGSNGYGDMGGDNGGSGGSNGYGDMGGNNDGSGGSNGYGDMGGDNDGSGGSNGYGDMGGDNGGSGGSNGYGDMGGNNGGSGGSNDSSRMAESNESFKQQEITEIKVLDKLIQILNHDELVEKFFNEKAALINLENFSSDYIKSMSTSEKETLGKNAEAICLEMDTITKHVMELGSSLQVDHVCRRAEDLKQNAIQVQKMIKLHSGKRYTHPEQLQEVLSESVKTYQKQKQEQSKIKERLLQNCQEAGLHFRGETPANGNCFFEAISSQLERLGLPWKSAEELRSNVTQFLLENRQFAGPDQNSIIDIKEFLEDETLEDYIMKMAKNGEYADHVIIFVMCKYLQREIIIIQSSPNTQRENCICIIGDFEGDPLLLGHYWEYHYQSLEPKNC